MLEITRILLKISDSVIYGCMYYIKMWNAIWLHLYVESKEQNKQTNNRTVLDTESRRGLGEKKGLRKYNIGDIVNNIVITVWC